MAGLRSSLSPPSTKHGSHATTSAVCGSTSLRLRGHIIARQGSDSTGGTATGPTAVPQQRLILFTLTAFQFVSIADFMVVMPLAPQLRAAFALTTQQFGWVVSTYTLAAGVAAGMTAVL